MCLTEPLLNKQCRLIASSWRKDYIQIIAFLASGGGVEKNLKALQMKTIMSLGGRAIRKTFSSINESLDGSHHAEQ